MDKSIFRLDKTAFKKVKLEDRSSSFAYWQTKSYEERISTIEFLRKQYHGTESRLQRVYTIIKRQPS